ncbi:hypothetical protein [Agrococcus terreus]|uniref:Uncharacterized protein n=1 Tax=Agrococcus terreus TaxID=574649 RepID=A0ABQ2KPZ8_9MICO|nr:hypothetical protein [Agrococcus terreus]GGN89157.1 hypothetical protein GCM10010968_25530 [Agrococcus terreus]
MIPADWIPHRRADRELVGYLREAGDGFQAMDLFGRPLGEPADWLEAEEALEAHGLAWLMEPFLLDVDGRDVRVRVVEATPQRIRVKRDDFGDIGAEQAFWEVPVPETGRLRPAPPLTEWPGPGAAR